MPFSKKRDLLQLALLLSEKIHCPAPRRLLMTVEFAKVEDMALHHSVASHSAVLHDTSVEMIFAVLTAFFATQEHAS